MCYDNACVAIATASTPVTCVAGGLLRHATSGEHCALTSTVILTRVYLCVPLQADRPFQATFTADTVSRTAVSIVVHAEISVSLFLVFVTV